MANQKPVWKTQAGQVSVALWQNDAVINGRSVRMLKATVERRYKDGDTWKSSQSFGRNEVPLVLWGLTQAYSKMLEKNGAPDEANADDEQVM